MPRLLPALLAVALLFAAACGGDDDTDAEGASSSDEIAADTDSADDDAESDDDGASDDGESDGGGSIDADRVETATLTVEPEGETFDVGSTCELNTSSFSGIVDDASAEGTSVTIAFDNTSDDSAAFLFNVVATGKVDADGTFAARSRGGVDNSSVNFTGTGTAEIVEADGNIGRVRFVFDLVQAGPVTDPDGPPVFDDQPAERTITGDAICYIGIT